MQHREAALKVETDELKRLLTAPRHRLLSRVARRVRSRRCGKPAGATTSSSVPVLLSFSPCKRSAVRRLRT
jgi:hypothetical protein